MFFALHVAFSGLGSSVGTATGYGLDDPGIETTVLEEGEVMFRELPCSQGLGHRKNPHLCWCKGSRMENEGLRGNSYSQRNTEQYHHDHAQYNKVNVKRGHYMLQLRNDHVRSMTEDATSSHTATKYDWYQVKIFARQLSTHVTHPTSNHQQTKGRKGRK
jgi:hypothetical protein